MTVVAIALLGKGFSQVKVPRNHTPGFPNRQGFLGVPLLQAVPAPEFVRFSVLDLLFQFQFAAVGKFKEYGGFSSKEHRLIGT